MKNYYQSHNDSILSNLDLSFANKINQLLNLCSSRDVNFSLIEGLRPPLKQALYWKGGRTSRVAMEKIEYLQANDADFLAYCLYILGNYKSETIITNAIPGCSWHQYGLAVDFVWILNGNFCWDNLNQYNKINGYEILAEEATKIGLHSGHLWDSFKDSGHIQAHIGSPLDFYDLKTISSKMEKKFKYLFKNKLWK